MNAARRFASNNLSSFQSAREREEDEVPYAHRPVRSKIENRKHTHEKIEKQKNAENASLFLFWKASRRAKRERERKRKRKKPLFKKKRKRAELPTLPSETARKVLCIAKSKIPTPYSSSRDTSASILAESSSAKLYGQARFPFNTDCNADCGRALKLLHFVRLSPRPPRSNTTRIAHRIDHGNSTR